jgi:hypothetical protein
MSQVYTFCKSGGSKTSSNTSITPINPSTSTSTSISYKPPNTGAEKIYGFKREDQIKDASKPVNFTEEDFPSLGGLKTSTSIPQKNGSWGDASKSAIIREPFPEQVAVVKKNVPPLFSKVKKTTKTVYYEDDEDEDELCDNYESDSDAEIGQDFRNSGYGDYDDEEEEY